MTTAAIDTLIRLTMVSAPLVVLVVIGAAIRPALRARMAALLASVAALLGIVVLNTVATPLNWWSFVDPGATLLGQPVDLVLAWAVLWGAIPTLLDRWRLSTTLAALAALDLLSMPLLPDLALGSSWLVGEVVGLVLVAAPAITLGRLTAQRRHLPVRTALQVGFATLLLTVVGPLLAGSLGGGLHLQDGVIGWVGLQAAVVGGVVALAAVQEFLVRGQGTPWPWDPPRRLVTTGPYRFVSNPMQLGGTLLLLGQAVLYASPWLAGMAVVGALFAATSARVHEFATIGRRFGASWTVYQASVRAWWPRWRPVDSTSATLWVAESCGACRDIGVWIERRHPVGLTIRPAEQHPTRSLQRAAYEAADGHTTTGVDAIAHAAEHLDAWWAGLGLLLRLPGVRSFARVIGDAVGFGPQQLTATGEEVATACTNPRTHVSG